MGQGTSQHPADRPHRGRQDLDRLRTGAESLPGGAHALYLRLPRLLQEMAIAKGDGRYPKLLATLAKTEVLILDDWGLAKLTAEHRRDVLEILEDRHGARSTLATSQLPIEKWHDTIGDPTMADAILDRLVHNAYKINLKGGSMRKRKANLTQYYLTRVTIHKPRVATLR